MKTWEDYYEEALDAIREAQGEDWRAYSAADIQSAEEQANQAMSERENLDSIEEKVRAHLIQAMHQLLEAETIIGCFYRYADSRLAKIGDVRTTIMHDLVGGKVHLNRQP